MTDILTDAKDIAIYDANFPIDAERSDFVQWSIKVSLEEWEEQKKKLPKPHRLKFHEIQANLMQTDWSSPESGWNFLMYIQKSSGDNDILFLGKGGLVFYFLKFVRHFPESEDGHLLEHEKPHPFIDELKYSNGSLELPLKYVTYLGRLSYTCDPSKSRSRDVSWTPFYVLHDVQSKTKDIWILACGEDQTPDGNRRGPNSGWKRRGFERTISLRGQVLQVDKAARTIPRGIFC